MEKLKAITIAENEAFLRQISLPVDLKDRNLQQDIKVLEEYCKENAVLAMAAVQLGIPKRLVYVKNTNLDIVNKMQSNSETEEERNYNEARVLINPVILSKEGLTTYWEACASCLDNIGHVKRPYRIVVEYVDLKNQHQREVFEGFAATVLSHEMDHLDGILHMDIADEVLVMPKEERMIFRQSNKYTILSKTGDYEQLRKDSPSLKRTKS